VTTDAKGLPLRIGGAGDGFVIASPRNASPNQAVRKITMSQNARSVYVMTIGEGS